MAALGVILTILKIIGIVLLGVLALAILIAFAVLFVPIRYGGEFAGSFKKDDFKANDTSPNLKGELKASWLFHILYLSSEYDKDEMTINTRLRVFGFIAKNWTKGLKEEKDEIGDSFSDDDLEDLFDVSMEQESHRKPGLRGKLSEFTAKYEKARKDVTDEDNIIAVKLIRDELINLIRLYKPRKLKGFLDIGFEDPSLTGKALGLYYMLFSPSKNFRFTGNFEDEVFSGDVTFKGRCRLNHLATSFIKCYKNDVIKSWIKKDKRSKKEK